MGFAEGAEEKPQRVALAGGLVGGETGEIEVLQRVEEHAVAAVAGEGAVDELREERAPARFGEARGEVGLPAHCGVGPGDPGLVVDEDVPGGVDAVAVVVPRGDFDGAEIADDAASYPLIFKSAPRLEDFCTIIKNLQAVAAAGSVSELVRMTIETTGYGEMLESEGEISKDKVNTLQGITEDEANEIARKVGLGALKYFILKVDPRKNMLFNPAESIDFNGNTGPFIQYTYARIQSVLRKAETSDFRNIDMSKSRNIEEKELALIQRLCEYPTAVRTAGDEFSPAILCNYAYALACDFNSFYHDLSILNEPDEQKKTLRLLLSANVAKILNSAFGLLGIEMPERM